MRFGQTSERASVQSIKHKTVSVSKTVHVKREQVKTRGSEFLEDGVYVLEKSVVRGDYQSVTMQATRVHHPSNEQQINNNTKREVSALLKKVHLASQIQEEWSLQYNRFNWSNRTGNKFKFQLVGIR